MYRVNAITYCFTALIYCFTTVSAAACLEDVASTRGNHTNIYICTGGAGQTMESKTPLAAASALVAERAFVQLD